VSYPFYTRDVTDIAVTGADRRRDHPSGYLPPAGLVDAVNVALDLSRPLLLTGEPGTGKTQLAHSVAWQLAGRGLLNVTSAQIEKFETKSTSVAKDLFYTFDTLSRFQSAYSRQETRNRDYLTYNALGRAILNSRPREEIEQFLSAGFQYSGPRRSVVLIDEVDKAPRDFPNDLLNEIDQMYFRIPELGNAEVSGAVDDYRPIVIITNNSERNLPDPFLRRCIYYDIPFPTSEQLQDILSARLTDLGPTNPLARDALRFFGALRDNSAIRRRISPAELLQWLSFIVRRLREQQRSAASLEEAREIATSGLSSLIKDPEDQKRVVLELDEHIKSKSTD
jgi:MoxR-like ATPase